MTRVDALRDRMDARVDERLDARFSRLDDQPDGVRHDIGDLDRRLTRRRLTRVGPAHPTSTPDGRRSSSDSSAPRTVRGGATYGLLVALVGGLLGAIDERFSHVDEQIAAYVATSASSTSG